MGPCITTVEDIPYPPKLSIQSRVNGELRQDSNTELLIFGIDHIVSELSKGMTLKPGTIIATAHRRRRNGLYTAKILKILEM